MSVDENLFYMGVDKSRVDPARLSQARGVDAEPVQPILPAPDASEPGEAPRSDATPRHLFHSAASLLAMTRKHNVGFFSLMVSSHNLC